MILRIDPSYGTPDALARVYADRTEKVDFRSGPGRCGRCNDDLNVHWWQLVDPNETEQGGVMDCAPAPN